MLILSYIHEWNYTLFLVINIFYNLGLFSLIGIV